MVTLATELPLGEVCDLRTGFSRRPSSDITHKSDYPILRGADLANPQIKITELETQTLETEAAESYRLNEGEIVIPRVSLRPRAVIVSGDLAGAVPHHTVLVLKPHHRILSPEYLAAFLSSERFKELANQTCSTLENIPMLTTSSISSIPVPIYSMDILADFPSVYSDAQDLVNKADELQRLVASFFDISNFDYLRDRLNERRISAFAARSSITASTDFDFRVKTFFHFPIAYPVRLLQSEFETTKLQHQLHQVSEGIAAYVAGILLSAIPTPSKELASMVKRCLGGNGATFGNWIQIHRRCLQDLQDVDDELSPFHRDIKNLLIRAVPGESFSQAIDSLLKFRNDFHHRGALAGPKAETGIEEIYQSLRIALKELSILITHPIYLPLDFDKMRDKSTVSVTALRYTGDHPGMSKILKELPEAPKKNDLYLAVEDGYEWISLYPFVLVKHCQGCNTRETYYVDGWKAGGPARLKSFERGHLEESIEIGRALEYRFR